MKRLSLIFIAILVGFTAMAQDVTLIVDGQGITKDQAINSALRSAVEQAYGTFVSSNTEILNDELLSRNIQQTVKNMSSQELIFPLPSEFIVGINIGLYI